CVLIDVLLVAIFLEMFLAMICLKHSWLRFARYALGCVLPEICGGNDEGSATANSVMHALADGDRELEVTGSSIGTTEGSIGARIVNRILLRSSSSSSGLESSMLPGNRAVGKASVSRG
nr:hypothetical protein [Tanacetum cinerariifolium]